MTKSKSYTIRLLNKSYQIKCSEDESQGLQLAALKLNNQVLAQKKKSKQLEAYDALLLAALHISHELISCQNQREQRSQQLSHLITSLESRIRQAAIDISLLDSPPDA